MRVIGFFSREPDCSVDIPDEDGGLGWRQRGVREKDMMESSLLACPYRGAFQEMPGFLQSIHFSSLNPRIAVMFLSPST